MLDPELLLGFLALSALLSAVPGPSVVLATGEAITRGRTSAMRIVLGNALGGLILLALVVLGLGAIVTASATVFMIVKILGAVYLGYLGVRALLAAWRGSETLFDHTDDLRDEPGTARLLRQGFTVGVSNPKSIVSLMAVLPQFVDPSHGSVALQMLVIGLTGGVVQVMVESTWVLAASSLRAWFRRKPIRIRSLRAAGGFAMIGFAGRLAFQRP